jgi:hypothetical protein
MTSSHKNPDRLTLASRYTPRCGTAKQLDYYLDEFTFRFNRRTSRSRGLLFYRLLEQAVVTEPVTYHHIVARRGKHKILCSVELNG